MKKKIKFHGSKPFTKGMLPEYRTVCGEFGWGDKETQTPADRLVENPIFNEDWVKINCPLCLGILVEQKQELSKSWDTRLSKAAAVKE